jgi:hypothetical protein
MLGRLSVSRHPPATEVRLAHFRNPRVNPPAARIFLVSPHSRSLVSLGARLAFPGLARRETRVPWSR